MSKQYHVYVFWNNHRRLKMANKALYNSGVFTGNLDGLKNYHMVLRLLWIAYPAKQLKSAFYGKNNII